MNTAMINSYSKPPTRDQSGFTLVEMLIVVALVGILMGLALPNFVKIRRITKVNNAANQVYNGLQRARNLALRKQRPVLIKVLTSANQITFNACIDQNFASVPGADNASSVACDANDVSPDSKEDPFFQGQLVLNNPVTQENVVSLGYPASGSSNFTAQPTNMGTAAQVYWFGFDSSGKLIPDGRSPFATTSDVTALTSYPVITGANPVGPEFYMAEYNATANNSSPTGHIYRKVEISMLGGIRVLNWENGKWEGVK